jgi:hypothetical protein
MVDQEFWLLFEFKSRAAGELTHSDYDEIQEFMRADNG